MKDGTLYARCVRDRPHSIKALPRKWHRQRESLDLQRGLCLQLDWRPHIHSLKEQQETRNKIAHPDFYGYILILNEPQVVITYRRIGRSNHRDGTLSQLWNLSYLIRFVSWEIKWKENTDASISRASSEFWNCNSFSRAFLASEKSSVAIKADAHVS